MTLQGVSVECLRDTDIFAGLSDNDLGEIAKQCTQRDYQAGQNYAVQGDTVHQLLIVKEGKVAIKMQCEVKSCAQTITVVTLTNGRVCAWSALVPPYVLTASIECVERTQMVTIEASALLRIFEERPAVASTIMKNLAGIISSRLIDSRNQLVCLISELMKQAITI